MDTLHRFGPLSAAEVCARLPDAPSDTAMRTLLRILADKGLVRHDRDGRRKVYTPAFSRRVAQKSAVRHIMKTFFGGGVREAVAALLDEAERPLTDAERKELIAMISNARQRGR